MRNSNASPSLGLLFSTATALISPANETVTRRPLYGSVPQLTVRSATSSAIRSLLLLITAWHRRIDERKRLGLLDDRMLRDIGLDRQDVAIEIEKPFWKP